MKYLIILVIITFPNFLIAGKYSNFKTGNTFDLADPYGRITSSMTSPEERQKLRVTCAIEQSSINDILSKCHHVRVKSIIDKESSWFSSSKKEYTFLINDYGLEEQYLICILHISSLENWSVCFLKF